MSSSKCSVAHPPTRQMKCLFLLVLVALCCLSSCIQGSSPATAASNFVVETSEGLLNAILASRYSASVVITVASDISLYAAKEWWDGNSMNVTFPISVLGNITILGYRSELPYPTLDLALAKARLQLHPGAYLTFQRLHLLEGNIHNDPNVEWLAKSTGATVMQLDCVVHRVACVPVTAAVAAKNVTLPDINSSVQLPTNETKARYVAPLCVPISLTAKEPRCFDIGLDCEDCAVPTIPRDDSWTTQGLYASNPGSGGFVLWTRRSSIVCEQYVNTTCLISNGEDFCIVSIVTQYYNTRNAQQPPAVVGARQPTGDPSATGADDDMNTRLLAIILPTCIGGTLLLALVGAAVYVVHARRDLLPDSMRKLLGMNSPATSFSDEPARALEAGSRKGDATPSTGTPLPGGLKSSWEPGAPAAVAIHVERDAVEGDEGSACVSEVAEPKPISGPHTPQASAGLPKLTKAKVEELRKSVVLSTQSPSDGSNHCSSLVIMEQIGSGMYGKVFKGTWDGHEVAIKRVILPVGMSGSERHERMALMEAAISSVVSHPNIVQTFTYSILPMAEDVSKELSKDLPITHTESGMSGNAQHWQLQLILEYCDANTLRDALDKKAFRELGSGRPDYGAVLLVAMDVARAMVHLHHHGIVHSDLKARNVLLKTHHASPSGYLAKVADFGLSLHMDAHQSHISGAFQGTPTHMAPEVLLYGRVSKAADVYAFGILLFELWTAGLAFKGIPRAILGYKVAVQNERPRFPASAPLELVQLATHCWAKEPGDRPTFSQVCAELRRLLDTLPGHPHPSSGQSQSSLPAALLAPPQQQYQQPQAAATLPGVVSPAAAATAAAAAAAAAAAPLLPAVPADDAPQGAVPAQPAGAGAGASSCFLSTELSTELEGPQRLMNGAVPVMHAMHVPPIVRYSLDNPRPRTHHHQQHMGQDQAASDGMHLAAAAAGWAQPQARLVPLMSTVATATTGVGLISVTTTLEVPMVQAASTLCTQEVEEYKTMPAGQAVQQAGGTAGGTAGSTAGSSQEQEPPLVTACSHDEGSVLEMGSSLMRASELGESLITGILTMQGVPPERAQQQAAAAVQRR
mmetsp:Transcript_36334/g.80856  ORF Transcript_36334/g.80856 Transcript_36334/m.80856 type:complete len:1087 (+) Transcript_36334:74-3334(+)